MSSSRTPPLTRKGGSKVNTPPPPPTLQDFKKLLSESEERVISKFNAKIDTLLSKVTALESAINDVKAVQVQQEMCIAQMKDVIAEQQGRIEAFDERERRCNLIVSNLPETSITLNEETFENDETKVLALVNEILPASQELDSDDVHEVVRLGRPGMKPRILRVKFSEESSRNKILRSCRNLNSSEIQAAFGRIYINKDLSFLRRQEEKRLRQRRSDLKKSYPEADVRIKNGKLFLGPAIRDCIDYRNQLF